MWFLFNIINDTHSIHTLQFILYDMYFKNIYNANGLFYHLSFVILIVMVVKPLPQS